MKSLLTIQRTKMTEPIKSVSRVKKDDVSEVDEPVYLLTPGNSPQAAPAPKHFCVFGSEYVHMDVEPLYLYYKTDWASASGDRARFYRLPNDKV